MKYKIPEHALQQHHKRCYHLLYTATFLWSQQKFGKFLSCKTNFALK